MIVVTLCELNLQSAGADAAQIKKTTSTKIPKFEFDPTWPKLTGHFGEKGNWIFGALGGIAVDQKNDHVWILQRPKTLSAPETLAATKPPIDECCISAPTVMEFDAQGNFLQGWGGPGPGYDWPEIEHGIRIDYKGNVWIGGSGKNDNQLLKFTQSGKFLLQIGHPGKSAGSIDTENMNVPASTFVYPKTNEVFVADGYVNRRVVVFDADTGAFKRMWGAYGKKPDDSVPRIKRFPVTEGLPLDTVIKDPPPQQFNLPHALVISNDGLVYVADRTNNRVQIFKTDGTFVTEVFIARQFLGPVGTAVDLALSPDPGQRYLYVMSGDEHLRILDRKSLKVIGRFGRLGHFPGQFWHTHAITVDSKNNIYTAEAGTEGRRVQKFLFKGYSTTSTR
jgi:hypothetical protein